MGNDFAVSSTASPSIGSTNTSNDFTQEDDIIYVKGEFTIGEWTRVGTITVEINETVEATAITNRDIPDPSKNEGYYGFVFREKGDAFNFFEDSSAISMEKKGETGMQGLGLSCHILAGVDNYINNLDEDQSQYDTNTGAGTIDPGSEYSYYSEPIHPWDGSSAVVKTSAAGKDYLCRKWTRDWYFRYPTQEEIDTYNLQPEDYSFWHEDSDMAAKKFNITTDLSLSGLLAAVPFAADPVYKITSITTDVTDDEQINDIGLESAGFENGLDDWSWILSTSGYDGVNPTITIVGDPGAQFKLEFEKVSTNDFTTGRSLGSSEFGRATLDWSTTYTPDGAVDLGTTSVMTISETGQIEFEFPNVNAHSNMGDGNSYNNYYLRVIAESNT